MHALVIWSAPIHIRTHWSGPRERERARNRARTYAHKSALSTLDPSHTRTRRCHPRQKQIHAPNLLPAAMPKGPSDRAVCFLAMLSKRCGGAAQPGSHSYNTGFRRRGQHGASCVVRGFTGLSLCSKIFPPLPFGRPQFCLFPERRQRPKHDRQVYDARLKLFRGTPDSANSEEKTALERWSVVGIPCCSC